MDPFEKDEIPMLSATFSHSEESNEDAHRPFRTRTRSASMSNPSLSLDSSEHESNLVGFPGPLRNERRNSFVQMSGPLFVTRNSEAIFQTPQITTEPKMERYPSMDGVEGNDGAVDNYMGKNEHLLKSGPLGMCSDPYCTTCPSYYNVKAQKHSRKSDIDARVLFFVPAVFFASRFCLFDLKIVPCLFSLVY